MQLPVQLDVTPVIQKVYVIRLDARQDISTQQDISVSVSIYSSAYISYFLTVL